MSTYVKSDGFSRIGSVRFSKTIIDGVVFYDGLSFLNMILPNDGSLKCYIIKLKDNIESLGGFYASTDLSKVKQFLKSSEGLYVLQLDDQILIDYGFKNVLIDLRNRYYAELKPTPALNIHFSRFLLTHGIIRSPTIVANFLEELQFEYYGGMDFLEGLAYETCLHCLLHNSHFSKVLTSATDCYYLDPIGVFYKKFKILPEKYMKRVRLNLIKNFILLNRNTFEQVFYDTFKIQYKVLLLLGINKLEFKKLMIETFAVNPQELYLRIKLTKTK
jgi:hypothetical protein